MPSNYNGKRGRMMELSSIQRNVILDQVIQAKWGEELGHGMYEKYWKGGWSKDYEFCGVPMFLELGYHREGKWWDNRMLEIEIMGEIQILVVTKPRYYMGVCRWGKVKEKGLPNRCQGIKNNLHWYWNSQNWCLSSPHQVRIINLEIKSSTNEGE